MSPRSSSDDRTARSFDRFARRLCKSFGRIRTNTFRVSDSRYQSSAGENFTLAHFSLPSTLRRHFFKPKRGRKLVHSIAQGDFNSNAYPRLVRCQLTSVKALEMLIPLSGESLCRGSVAFNSFTRSIPFPVSRRWFTFYGKLNSFALMRDTNCRHALSGIYFRESTRRACARC